MLQAVAKMQTTPNQENAATFADFWLLYPKKVARRDAEQAFARMSEEDRMAALVGLVKWRQVWIARGEMQFTPHAGTWLRGARWEDELPEEWVAKAGHASHQPAVLPNATFQKSEMPADVKAAIAKLRLGR